MEYKYILTSGKEYINTVEIHFTNNFDAQTEEIVPEAMDNTEEIDLQNEEDYEIDNEIIDKEKEETPKEEMPDETDQEMQDGVELNNEPQQPEEIDETVEVDEELNIED